MDTRSFDLALAKRVSQVCSKDPSLAKEREQNAWCRGWLGDHRSGIWFVAEKASLSPVEKVSRSGIRLTPEMQWAVSRGDHLFRKGLVRSGFKSGGIFEPGGWNCYITNVIKAAEFVKERKERSKDARRREAEAWAPVLNWELQNSVPALVVLMGNIVSELLEHLEARSQIKLPTVMQIDHYSYIAFRYCHRVKLPPNHPKRVEQYLASFEQVRSRLEGLRRPAPS